LDSCTEPEDWQPVAFGMALDVDNGRVVLRLSGDADTSVATAIGLDRILDIRDRDPQGR
jgi:hypothetical protein